MIAFQHFRRRFVVVLTVAMCAAVVGGIARTAILPDREQPFLSSKVWYRLELSAGTAACRLAAGSGRYTLVIGCLADASETHQVRLRLTNESGHGGQMKNMGQAARLLVLSDEATGELSALRQPLPQVVERPSRSLTTSASAKEVMSSNHVALLGTTRDFFIHVTDGELNDPKQYARMTAQCLGEGDRVRVYVDQQLGTDGIRGSQIADLIHLLETDVLPRVEAQFGTLVDVDQDGRFAIVISPWLSRLQGGHVSINGMVRSTDFRCDVAPPLGNQCDMLLLNSALPCGAALRDLLSHEVAHAACISQRVRHQSTKVGDEQDWVSEGLAHLAEPTVTNSAERIATFLDDPSRHPLVIPDYYRAGLWRDPGCRGATVLFSKWCAAKHGPGLCRRLVQSTESGKRTFEQATSQTFEDLFRQWSVSLVDESTIQSLDSRGHVGSHQLAGARRHQWETENGEELSLSIRGTAIAVVEWRSDDSHATTIRLAGDSAAHWQFSVRVK